MLLGVPAAIMNTQSWECGDVTVMSQWCHSDVIVMSQWCHSDVIVLVTVWCCYGIIVTGMGESNCAWNRRNFLKRTTIQAAAALYKGKGTRPLPPRGGIALPSLPIFSSLPTQGGVNQWVLSSCWKSKVFGYYGYMTNAHSKNAAHVNYLVGGLAEFIEVSSPLQSYELTWDYDN